MTTRLDVLQQRREFLIEQYKSYREQLFHTENLLTKSTCENWISCLYEDIVRIDNLLLKEVVSQDKPTSSLGQS